MGLDLGTTWLGLDLGLGLVLLGLDLNLAPASVSTSGTIFLEFISILVLYVLFVGVNFGVGHHMEKNRLFLILMVSIVLP